MSREQTCKPWRGGVQHEPATEYEIRTYAECIARPRLDDFSNPKILATWAGVIALALLLLWIFFKVRKG